VVLVLDTNCLANLEFLRWLKDSGEESYLPAVAYMEAFYHTLKRKRSTEMFRSALAAAAIKVYPFTPDQAEAAAGAAVGRWDFARNARDYAIGSVALLEKATMVTENKKDFAWLPQVKSPREAMEAA